MLIGTSFNNTRLAEEQLEELNKALTQTFRNLYDLYSSTMQLIIYLPHKDGGIVIKRVSVVYRTTSIAFLIKMINYVQDQFRSSAHQFLNLDMLRRGVTELVDKRNFIGTDITVYGYLNNKTSFGCQSNPTPNPTLLEALAFSESGN